MIDINRVFLILSNAQWPNWYARRQSSLVQTPANVKWFFWVFFLYGSRSRFRNYTDYGSQTKQNKRILATPSMEHRTKCEDYEQKNYF